MAEILNEVLILQREFEKQKEKIGGMQAFARKSNLNRENLYGIFSGKHVPDFKTLDKMAEALGLERVTKYRRIRKSKSKSNGTE